MRPMRHLAESLTGLWSSSWLCWFSSEEKSAGNFRRCESLEAIWTNMCMHGKRTQDTAVLWRCWMYPSRSEKLRLLKSISRCDGDHGAGIHILGSWYPHLTIKWLKFWYQSMEACCFLSWIPWKQSLIQKLGRNLVPASCRLALLLASLCCTFKWLEKRVPQLPNLVHSSDDSNLKQWESVIPIFCMFKLHYRQCVRPCSFPSSTWELWGTAVTHRCFPLSQWPLGDPCSPQTSCVDFELCWELCRSFASWSGGLQMSRCLLKSDPHDPVSSGIVAAAHICGHC